MDTTYLLGHGGSRDRGHVSREVAEVYSLVAIRVEAEVIVLGNLLKALVAFSGSIYGTVVKPTRAPRQSFFFTSSWSGQLLRLI